MKRHFLLLVVLLTLGATVAHAQTANSSAVPFQISSIESSFAMAGTFRGEYQMRADSIEITIFDATVHLRDFSQYKGRRMLAFINVSLASASGAEKWKIINRGMAIPVGETMGPGDKYMADKMRFTIRTEPGLELSKCWLIVEMGELTLDEDSEDKVGYAFARSGPDIFSPSLAKAARR